MKTKNIAIIIVVCLFIFSQIGCGLWCLPPKFSHAIYTGTTRYTHIRVSPHAPPPPLVYEISNSSIYPYTTLLLLCAAIDSLKPTLYVFDNDGYLISKADSKDQRTHEYKVSFIREPDRKYYLMIVFPRPYNSLVGEKEACMSIYTLYKYDIKYYPPLPNRN